MNWLTLLNEIFEVCIIPFLGILTAYIVKYIQIKTEEIQKTTENKLIEKYINMLSSTVSDCVIATNQTYVETLKKEGKFDLTAQKTAYEMTKTAVMSILTEETKKYLTLAVGDLNIYISQLIESAINAEKV